MRAVTFSTPEIQNAISNQFIAFTSNIEGDPTSGESIGHAPGEQPGDCIRGNGRQNVQTTFLTPDLEIFHVASGFVSPQEMATEMAFAANLFNDLRKDETNRFDLVRSAHQDGQSKGGVPLAGRGTRSVRDFMTAMNGGNPSGMSNPWQRFTDQFVLDDHRYMVTHPLVSPESFQADPGGLVGRGKTFFSGSKSSSR